MKLNNLKVKKIIDKDFDQFKKILEVPKNANKFIAFNQNIGNFTINEITNESITGDYWIGKFKYDISFTKNDENKIIYQFKATNYYPMIFAFICLLIYQTIETDVENLLVFLELGVQLSIIFLCLCLFLLLINSAVRKTIYNRIHNRWDSMNYVDSIPFTEELIEEDGIDDLENDEIEEEIEEDEINEIVKNGLNKQPKRKDYKSSSDYVKALRKYHKSNKDNKLRL